MSTTHDVNVLKDVLTLLHPDLLSKVRGEEGHKENCERRSRMTAWLTQLQESVSNKDMPWDMDDGGLSSTSIKIVPRFIQLMRDCMLAHRWPQVLRILDCLAHMPEGTDWVVWKAGLAVLYTEPEVNCELIQQFFKQMYLLRELNLHSVVLEFVLYLLTQGMMQEASQVIQENRKDRPSIRRQQKTEQTRHLCDLLDAYQGVIFYVDWRQAIHRSLTQQPSMSESFYELTQPADGLSEEAIKQIATRALQTLDQLPGKEGIWDIFLPKALEIHEYYEDYDKARKLLEKYRTKNPDNPNSHRFLYEFLQRNCQHFETQSESLQAEIISCLKDIAKLDPGNPLTLTLCDRLAEAEDGEAAAFIFDLLDFHSWKDKPEGWIWLSDYLQKLLGEHSRGSAAHLQHLKECWAVRESWWPGYHFSHTSICCESSESRDLLVTKCVVASVLLGKDCEFCQKSRAAMKKKRIHQLDKVLSDMNLELFSPRTQSSEAEGRSPSKWRKVHR